MNKNIFYGLKNLNNGFDSDKIKYFSARDFEIILNRVKEFGLGIFGIEPWKNGEFYDVITNEEMTTSSSNSTWYFAAFKKFEEGGEVLQYAATYDIPEYLLK